MDNEEIRLRVIGITYNQIENGMYALILEDEESNKRIPIVVGYAEAQSIEVFLRKRHTERPLTHDLMATIFRTLEITLESVHIRRNSEGVFTSMMMISQNGEGHMIDSRSSDAIALAVRMGAPIYTTRDFVERWGMDKDRLHSKAPEEKATVEKTSEVEIKMAADIMSSTPNPLAGMSESTLQRLMDKAVNQENYEKAARIKDELERRTHKE